MQDCGIWLRRAAIAALTAASFALPVVTAYADQQPAQTQAANEHAKKPYPKKHAAETQAQWRRSQAAWQPTPAQQWVQKRCAWPYQNQFPPCMSTWPGGDPHYHGPIPGPTFDD